ncbi:hypothetical protein HDU79_009705 [Rhizoclosmatium sp. JEL0117]|nr:hypothetical protein HDU79_009705 [Rhizoclosmatium sp. JEL0117]
MSEIENEGLSELATAAIIYGFQSLTIGFSFPASQILLLNAVECLDEETARKQASHTMSLKEDGPFSAVSKLIRMQGFGGLWKGYAFTCASDIFARDIVKSYIYDCLYWFSRLPASDDSFITAPNALARATVIMASDVITGVLLSPLELVKTRIIVQTHNSANRKYTNSFTALPQILREEGFGAVYARGKLIPKILLETISTIDTHLIPLFLIRGCGLDPSYQPITYRAVRFGFGLVSTLLMLPLETVLLRMECQCIPLPGQRIQRFDTTVPTDQVPYTDMRDCIRRVVVAKRKFLEKRGKKGSGMSGLFHGWQLHVVTSFLVAIVQDSSF